MKVLIINHYDSFVYNLAQYVGELGGEPLIFQHDQISVHKALALAPERIIISPGPGNPTDEKYFSSSAGIIKELGTKIPTLGVCLGHQGIGHVFGGKIRRARILKHGKTSSIEHDGKGIHSGMALPFQAARYHSLVIDDANLPEDFVVSAWSQDDGEIMGIRHKKYPLEGIQYHPESILTEDGKRIIYNFLK